MDPPPLFSDTFDSAPEDSSSSGEPINDTKYTNALDEYDAIRKVKHHATYSPMEVPSAPPHNDETDSEDELQQLQASYNNHNNHNHHNNQPPMPPPPNYSDMISIDQNENENDSPPPPI